MGNIAPGSNSPGGDPRQRGVDFVHRGLQIHIERLHRHASPAVTMLPLKPCPHEAATSLFARYAFEAADGETLFIRAG